MRKAKSSFKKHVLSIRYETALKEIGEKMNLVLTSEQKEQVALFFLKESRKTNSSIAKKLEAVRDELMNGYVPKDQVVPYQLKRSDLEIMTESSEIYVGSWRGEDEFEKGYQHGKFTISIQARSASYAARTREIKGIVFNCTIDQEPSMAKPALKCSTQK